MRWPAWTREPLVHFIFAGALLYTFFAWSGGNAVDPASRVIEVTRDQQADLAFRFERTMGRAPTDAELDAQIDQFVRDEVLYREALRLGLDQGDAVVRRRLVSKMDMTASAAAELAEPGEAQLRAYFEQNRPRYSGAETVSFDQLYFADQASARAALSRIGTAGDWRGMGEAISLPDGMEAAAARAVRDRFGEQFSAVLAEIEQVGVWHGPVQSGFGWHLVRIQGRNAEAASFEALRPQIENDWRSAEIADRKARAYQLLREPYRVKINQ